MQKKLYRRSTVLLGLILIIDIGVIIWLFTNRNLWISYGYRVIVLFVLIIFALTFIYSYFDLNQDKMIIKKMVKNGDIALIKINNASLYRIIRDAKLKNKVIWKIDIDLYDQDMNLIKKEIYEKLSPTQTSIPRGYCFATYNPNKPNDILIIPNVIISSISEFAPLVEEYENKFKPTYLNVYYNNGLLIKTYSDSIKEEKEYKRNNNN